MLPLVSCICPTFNRRKFWPRCVNCFLRQDYPNLELVVLDDGDSVLDLMPDDERVRYYHELPKRNHGQKMNRCCELARGEFVIVWDDDDWYAPNRVSKQIQPMLNNPDIQITGTSQLYYYLHGTQQAFRYVNLTDKIWIGAIALRKSLWETHRFSEKPHGADFDLQNLVPHNQRHDLADPLLLVSAIHEGNAMYKLLPSTSFAEVPWKTIQNVTKEQL